MRNNNLLHTLPYTTVYCICNLDNTATVLSDSFAIEVGVLLLNVAMQNLHTYMHM